MHLKGIAHRDLKVENIMLHADGTIKICDLGLATDKDVVQSKSGTELYMAPEQYAKQLHDPRQADLFSLGVILFVMSTCSFPFRRATHEDEGYRLIQTGKYSEFWRLHEMIQDDTFSVPHSMRYLINTLLCHEPSDRLTFDDIRAHPWMQKQAA